MMIMMLAATMMFAQQANAQVKFGVKAGLNVNSMSFDNKVFDASNKDGFFLGPMIKLTVPITGLSFDAAALYNQAKAKVGYSEDNSHKTTITQKTIDIPVNVRYGVGLAKVANIFLFAGPQWGINVGDKDFKWNESSSYSLKSSSLSINVGVGATIIDHLQITANYNFGCTKSADATMTTDNGQTYEGSSRNNSWKIALGYWF